MFSRDVTGHVSRNFNRFLSPECLPILVKVFYRGAVLWNSLPSVVSEAATVLSFKICILILIDFFCFVLVLL